MDITAVIVALLSGGLGLLGYFVRKFESRLFSVEICATKSKLALAKKLDEDAVRRLIGDKLDPIHIMLMEMKDDIKEIKQDLKNV
jgi:hypothetical protein